MAFAETLGDDVVGNDEIASSHAGIADLKVGEAGLVEQRAYDSRLDPAFKARSSKAKDIGRGRTVAEFLEPVGSLGKTNFRPDMVEQQAARELDEKNHSEAAQQDVLGTPLKSAALVGVHGCFHDPMSQNWK